MLTSVPPMSRTAAILAGALYCFSMHAVAATRRALIVGINRYLAPVGAVAPWTPNALRPQPVKGIFPTLGVQNLLGAEADAIAMRDLLVKTYEFKMPEGSRMTISRCC